jgi:hypothetical protein
MVAITIMTHGRSNLVIARFPEWPLRRFSYKAKDDFKDLPRKASKTLRLEGPLFKQAVLCVLGWIEANQKAQGMPEHLLPTDLKLYGKMMVYQAANAFKLIPRPEALRMNINELLATDEISATDFVFCCEGLKFDKGLVDQLLRRTAELYIAGELDEEVEEIMEYTMGNHEIDQKMVTLVHDIVAFKLRDARRKGIEVQGVVYHEWHEPEPEPEIDETPKTPEDEKSIISSLESTSGDSTVPDEDHQAATMERCDSARQGLVALDDEDVSTLLKQVEIGFTIKPSKEGKKKRV